MLLAVNTSTAQVGLALYNRDSVLRNRFWTTRQHHTTELAPALAGLLARFRQFDGYGQRFGSCAWSRLIYKFAGWIGIGKGLALAHHVHHSDPTLILLPRRNRFENPLIAVIQAGRTRIAYSVYQSQKKEWQVEGELKSGTVDELIAGIKVPLWSQ